MRIVIHNQKGGVGKTTTAVNLGAALARLGAGPVTLVDLDPQMHLTAALGCDADAGWSVADWCAGRAGAPRPVDDEQGLFLVSGAPETVAADPLPPERLDALGPVAVVDTPPSDDPFTFTLMAAADIVLTPLEPDFLGLQGINRMLQAMQARGIPWDRLRLLLTRYSDRLAIHREVRARLADRFGARMLLPAVIHNSVRLAEAPGQALTIFNHAPRSSGARDYLALARSLVIPTDQAKVGQP